MERTAVGREWGGERRVWERVETLMDVVRTEYGSLSDLIKYSSTARIEFGQLEGG